MGVLSLNEDFFTSKESEWESTNNVWIFPDGGGPEFKFADGAMSIATPLSKTKVLGYAQTHSAYQQLKELEEQIVADPNDILTVLLPKEIMLPR